MKKICAELICVITSFVLLFGISFSSIRANASSTNNIISTVGSINVSSLRASVSAGISAASGVDKVKIKLELQKLESGHYSTTKTWQQTSDGRELSISKWAFVSANASYRLKATFYAHKTVWSSQTSYYY